jgi:hypothetical protein
MTGSCWRLLACFSLIFLLPALHAQDAVFERSTALAPTLEAAPSIPFSRPMLSISDRVPMPVDAPWRNPVAQGTIAFPQMVRAAGIIFSGHVTFVERAGGRVPSPSGASPGSTVVTFQVEHAIRGTSAGQSLTIHEWSGLWTGRERYRVGEHVFLFLYPPSKFGLTSPVGGGGGRFAIDPQGRIAMNPQNISALAADPVIGGRKVVPYPDFMRAVRRAGGVE